MIDILLDSTLDLLKLVPFLFISFLIMEILEHKIKNYNKLKNTNKLGPLIGASLGIIPQCGFSVVASNLYSVRIISLGTLLSIYLSTSDEMIPILLGSNVEIEIIIKILIIKFLLGLLFGIIVDTIIRKKEKPTIKECCIDEDCHCEEGILKSSIKHTIKISFFIFIVNILLGFLINEDTIIKFLNNNKILTPIISSIIGLIPNCASSVIITKLYASSILSLGSTISGLLSGSGLGLLILYKQNKNIKENIMITLLLITIASICGIAFNLI